FADCYVAGFEAAGGKRGAALESIEALAALLGSAQYAGATVLLKGSRAAGMDRLARLLSQSVGGSTGSC
ncbi:MAG: hypothetical protein HKO07_02850, partial [Pseudomonadales bacterium]|nr:hypothetical protein [Pseudomonadales bacterium]